ncbi:CPBP family intramembrane glutamic endopeptidase [Caproicibacterium lactatifermentans]|uniref:CPBP family intramembrane metalloprotease n=1 Tax=Caproicibacterium lactatifermentans TaxID=2666138 RepID=A0A859DRW9_9FIRM|nr:type II CAAX endopeptidase family protein [Caproicibacterium lactatifermentans]ARP51151.1 hypothetical protein B6259_09840 [Ruminococcaceae bacterium CPB6]MDD4807810.1 type II CAAX endopeptidase family protein [Oscillospiraceae bacterium]QKN24648.1 CPBP family intramembrane metalloprotease [Caproicibacterium lactatifermentans]QKO30147.1 CPBP family intramembrane metalloprotease [Caproicibacterium lactatifermentans]
MDYRYQMPVQNDPRWMLVWQERRGAGRAVNTASWLTLGSISVTAVVQVLLAFSLPAGASMSLQYLGDCVGYLLLALVPILYVCFCGRPTEEFLPFRRPAQAGLSGRDMLFLYVFGMGLMLACNLPVSLVEALEQVFGFSGEIPNMPLDHTAFTQVLYFLYGTLIPPLVEEVLFRGAVLGCLRRWGNWFAIVVSALLFGLYHGNVAQFVFAVLIGILFGYLRVRTESILPCIVLHMFNNGMASVGALLQENMGQTVQQQFTIAYFVICFVAAVAAVVVRLAVEGKGSMKKLRIPADRMLTSQWQRMRGMVTTAGGLLMLLYGVGSSIYVLMQSR